MCGETKAILDTVLSWWVTTNSRCDDTPFDTTAVNLAMNQLNAHSCSYKCPLSDEVEK
jgi:hypothetical protein